MELVSRSREGAWIEIRPSTNTSRSRKVAPARERGLKSIVTHRLKDMRMVAPARERGLKSRVLLVLTLMLLVAPARERGLKFDDG